MGMRAGFVALPAAEAEDLVENPGRVEALIDSPPPNRGLDIDKAWHAIHFLLSGSAEESAFPLGFICDGGEEVGDDMGYGPARLFSAADVRVIADALEPISRSELMSRWNAEALERAQIYAVRSYDPDGEEKYVGGYYEALKAFMTRAAKENLAVIGFVS